MENDQTSIDNELIRIETAKSDINLAIISSGGPSGNDDDLIDTYANRIRSIPQAVLSSLNVDLIGGSDKFIQSIKQTNGLIEATVGGVVDTSYSGLVPKINTDDVSISSQTDERILTSVSGNKPTWKKLPQNAFFNTTYSVMTGATASAAGKAGLVPAPSLGYQNRVLSGAGTWIEYPSNELKWNGDVRNTNTTPSDYKRKFKFVGIKSPTAIGLTSTTCGSWLSLIGWKGYSDNSGPKSWELASDQKNRLHVRSGTGVQSSGSGNEDWGNWNTIAYVSDLDWNNITNKPTSFAPTAHDHTTAQITALTNYSKATTAGNLATSDSLNTALGKLEYKADYAYAFIIATMSENNDSNTNIDRLKEVFDVLSGITETDTIEALVGKYLLLTGGKMTGAITPTTNNTLTLGTSNLKWNAVYATTFHGALSGNATSASKLGSSTLGSTTKPIYLNSGTATECSTYAGGTAVTLNGTSKAATTASFYAPTTAGTSNYVLKSNGSGAPTWIAQSSLSVGTASKLGTNTKGSTTKGIYLNAGVPTQMTYSLNATVNSGTVNRLAYYSNTNEISTFTIQQCPTNITSIYVWGSYQGSLHYAPNVTIKNGNAVYASGGFYESSDETLKNFYNDIEIDFDKLKQIPKKLFTWKKDKTNKSNIGTSAQELQKIYPELVSEDEEGILNVAYDKLSIIALAAIDKLYKDFNNKILILENEISNLKKTLNNSYNVDSN